MESQLFRFRTLSLRTPVSQNRPFIAPAGLSSHQQSLNIGWLFLCNVSSMPFFKFVSVASYCYLTVSNVVSATSPKIYWR